MRSRFWECVPILRWVVEQQVCLAVDYFVMRPAVLHALALLALLMILGGHVTELFDHWDRTLQTGREIDYTVVVVAAAGASVLLAVAASGLVVRLLRQLNRNLTPETKPSQAHPFLLSLPTSSPPISLRI